MNDKLALPDFPLTLPAELRASEAVIRTRADEDVVHVPMDIVTQLIKRHAICEQVGEDIHCQALKGPMSQDGWNIDNVMEFVKRRLEFRRSTKKFDLDDNECAWVLAYVAAQVCDTTYD